MGLDKYSNKLAGVYISKDVHLELKLICIRDSLTMSRIVENLIADWIVKYEKSKKRKNVK